MIQAPALGQQSWLPALEMNERVTTNHCSNVWGTFDFQTAGFFLYLMNVSTLRARMFQILLGPKETTALGRWYGAVTLDKTTLGRITTFRNAKNAKDHNARHHYY